MGTHTPGPWHVDNSSPGGGNIQSKTGPVADTLRFGNTHREAMADYANARLIAAAPLMLAALQEIVRLADDFHPSRDAEAPQALQEMREEIDASARSAIAAALSSEGGEK